MLLANIEKQKQEDIAAAKRKQVRVKEMMVQVELSNADAIAVKESRKMEEKRLEQGIVDYNKKKAAKEEQMATEAARVREEKEKEIQRLRELQEKAQDRQAEIDALRAKRAFEDQERGTRTKERLDFLKK